MEFYAHMKQDCEGMWKKQLLRDHLRHAAEYSRQSLRSQKLGNAAYLAGLFHDLGKYTDSFQAYLKGNRQRHPIHTFQGCRFLLEHCPGNAYGGLAAELLAYAVGAHHGLFDCVDGTGKTIGLKYRREKPEIGYEQAVERFFSDCCEKAELQGLLERAVSELERAVEKIDREYQRDDEYCYALGLLARLLLSAVMEGDRRDTAEFMNDADFPSWPEDTKPIWSERLEFLESKLAEFPQETPVQIARSALSQRCRKCAEQPGGIYRLNAPTGGGKTISSLRYALAHAAKYGHKRLIFTSPLLSILEQNAKEIRRYVGDDSLILEHHSNVVQTDQTSDELDLRELLVQTWDAPIILTTLVQLLNTLFDGKTTSVRRFHSLCDSIIVIDEVQTVPVKLLTMFNLAIRFLSEQCGATVILCSATQPNLEGTDHPLPKAPEDIVPYDPELWAVFARTRIKPLDAVRREELPRLVRRIMADKKSLLVVCNTKSEAAWLLNETRDEMWTSIHLSASMCVQHRETPWIS